MMLASTAPVPTLVLTACIEVANSSFVKRNNTAVRLADYKQSLRRWLTKQSVFRRIIFCDNSGYPLTELEAIARQYPQYEVEFLSYKLTDYQGHGYGWGEIDIYRHIVQHSQFLTHANVLFFCAGRKFVANANRILKSVPRDYDVVMNWLHNLGWSESDFFGVQRDVFVHNFLPALTAMTKYPEDEYIFERAIARVVHHLIIDDFTWYPLPEYPRYLGVMGKKDISLVWRKQNNWLFNRIASWISQLHYQLTWTHYNRQGIHVVDRLHLRHASFKLRKTS